MSEDANLAQQLKTKRICRFCMTLEEPLSNIYSTENRLNCRAPLPLQIMACVSIEVFTNDGMPSAICDSCRLLMDHSYRFKQMCKKADTALKQFPLTGVWPKKLELPRYPDELIKLQQPPQPPEPIISQPIKRECVQPVETTAPTKRQRLETSPVLQSPPQRSVKTEMDLEIIDASPKDLPPLPTQRKRPVPATKKVTPKPSPQTAGSKPRILNKNNMKILNVNAPCNNVEPILSKPVVRTDEERNVEIVSCEILENIEESDQITSATPVETNVFPCDYCERSFPLRQLLDIHMTNHVRERKYLCPICEKAFFSKYDLGKHSLIHTGERPYVCIVCKKAFSRSTLLARHEKIHTDQPKFLCVYCERPFLSKNELDKHTERHKLRRPFQCKICDKSFAFKQGLERHEVIHSKNQPHQCEHCDKSFPTPSKLARHLTAHAGRRPYPCRLCPKSYLLSHHLTRHLRSHKDGSGSYKCNDCDSVFASRDELIYHSAVHATQNLTCPLCKEKFDDLNGVTLHIKSHTEGEQYACEFCDLIFSTEQKLKVHSDLKHVDEQAAYIQDSKTRIIKREIVDSDPGTEEICDYILSTEIPEDGASENKTESNKVDQQKDADTEEELEEDIVERFFLESDNFDGNDNGNEEIIEEEIVISNELFSLPDTSPETKKTEFKILNKGQSQNQNQEKKLNAPRLRSATATMAANKSSSERPSIGAGSIIATNNDPIPKLPKSITVTRSGKTSTSNTKSTGGAKILSQTIIKPLPKVKATAAAAGAAKNSQENSDLIKQEKLSGVIFAPATTGSTTASATSPAKSVNKKSPATKTPASSDVEFKIGDETVRVQRVKMTKAQVVAMAREGKIEVKDGQVFLKQQKNS